MNELSGASFTMVGQRLRIKGATEPSMLLIRANWCGHCVRFLDFYKKMAKRLGKTFPLHSIEDTHINKDLGQALNFKGYPTIKFIDAKGYIMEDYKGERTEEAILAKICQVYHKCF
jgi:thiol-disulfide isomerase/thioredoxin